MNTYRTFQWLCGFCGFFVIALFSFVCHAQPQGVVEVRAVDSANVPLTLIRIGQRETKGICPLLSRIFFPEPSPAFPLRFSKFTEEQARTFRVERLSAFDASEYTLDILGKRLSAAPQETLTLLDGEADLKRATSLREYWQQVWGIAPERIVLKHKAELSRVGRCVEIAASPALMEPVVATDTLHTVQPSEIVFAPTVTNPETPVQWTIVIKQRVGNTDKILKNITTTGKVRPLVSWKIARELHTTPIDTMPLTYQLEVRYDNSPNRKSQRAAIAVQKLPPPTSRSSRILVLLGANETKELTAQNKALIERIKQENMIQATSTVTMTYLANNAASRDAERGAQAVAMALGLSKAQVAPTKNMAPQPYQTFMLIGDKFGTVVTISVETPIEKK